MELKVEEELAKKAVDDFLAWLASFRGKPVSYKVVEVVVCPSRVEIVTDLGGEYLSQLVQSYLNDRRKLPRGTSLEK